MGEPRLLQLQPQQPRQPKQPQQPQRWQRLALFGLFLGIIVFLGLLFWPFVREYIVAPLALFAWLLLRMFVLSIDQKYYWWFLVSVGILWMTRRFLRGQPVEAEAPVPTLNAAMKSVDGWRQIIHASAAYPGLRREVKRELTQMLITLFSDRQGKSAFSEVYEPLLKRQIPLPEPVYAFLFTPDPSEVRLSFGQRLRALPDYPRRWWRTWTGQEAAAYQQSIEAVLTYIERMLEAPDDDERSS